LVPVAQVVFSTASLVPPQAARSATESEFANFEDLFALLVRAAIPIRFNLI
jgi:hypothetical protein